MKKKINIDIERIYIKTWEIYGYQSLVEVI